MSRRFQSFTGFVLAGGASRRMGRPKALLVLNGETMVERQLRVLRSVTRRALVVGWPSNVPWPAKIKNLSGVHRLPDSQPGTGPLGGIYTGLTHSMSEFNLFIGCDMPFVEPELLQFLCRRALKSGGDVTVPKSHQRRLEPLCAVYRRRTLGAILASLKVGEYKVSRFFPSVNCEVIPWREIAKAGFPAHVFDNMNVGEDFEKAEKSLSRPYLQKSSGD